MTSQGTQTIASTAADQVGDINDIGGRVGFRYGPNRERVRRPPDCAGAGRAERGHGGARGGRRADPLHGDVGRRRGSALQEVRRYVGNVLVVQSGSGAGYRLTRQVLLTDRQGSTHQVLGAMTLQMMNAASLSSFDAWGPAPRRGELGSGVAVDAGSGKPAEIEHDARLHRPRDGRDYRWA